MSYHVFDRDNQYPPESLWPEVAKCFRLIPQDLKEAHKQLKLFQDKIAYKNGVTKDFIYYLMGHVLKDRDLSKPTEFIPGEKRRHIYALHSIAYLLKNGKKLTDEHIKWAEKRENTELMKLLNKVFYEKESIKEDYLVFSRRLDRHNKFQNTPRNLETSPAETLSSIQPEVTNIIKGAQPETLSKKQRETRKKNRLYRQNCALISLIYAAFKAFEKNNINSKKDEELRYNIEAIDGQNGCRQRFEANHAYLKQVFKYQNVKLTAFKVEKPWGKNFNKTRVQGR